MNKKSKSIRVAFEWRNLGFLIFFVLFIQGNTNAQSLGAAEVYFNQTGKYKYVVTANVYRRCDDSALKKIKTYVISDTFKIPIQLKRIGISKIYDTCGNPCNVQNTYSNKGYEKHVFQDTVDLNQQPFDSIIKAGMCEVKFAIHDQLRSNLITTHAVGNGMLYIDAGVNICRGFNDIHSPEFSIDPKLFTACNQVVNYSPGPIDTFDRDSLSYTMETPLLDYNTPVTYNGSFSVTYPVTPYCTPNPGTTINCRPLPSVKPPRGFYFDNQRCYMVYTLSNCSEVSNLKFKITKWRRDSSGKMQALGYVCREMMIQSVLSPFNNSPYIINNSIYTVCRGNKISFRYNIQDDQALPLQTKADTVEVVFNNGIAEGTYKILNPNSREKEVEFSWDKYDKYKEGSYLFSTAVYDQKCNVSMSSYSHIIRLKDTTHYDFESNIDSCGNLKFRVFDRFNHNLTGSLLVTDSMGQPVYVSGKFNDTGQIFKRGKFFFKYNYASVPNNCFITRYDTMLVDGYISKGFEYPQIDTNVCVSAFAKVQFKPSSIKNVNKWEWLANDTLFNTSDSSISRVLTRNTSIKLRVYDNRGCVSESQRIFYPYKNTQVLFTDTVYDFCHYDSAYIMPKINSLKQPLISHYVYLGNDTLFNGHLYTFKPQNKTTVYLSITDDNHCQVFDSIKVFPITTPDIGLNTDKLKYCEDSLVTIKSVFSDVSNYKKTEWQINGKDTLTPLTLFIHNIIKNNSSYSLKLTDKYNCVSYDTIQLIPLINPDFTLSKSDTICAGESIDINATVVSGVSKLNNTWLENDQVQTDNDLIYNFNGKTDAWIKLKLNNDGTCFTEDSVFIKVNPLPVFEIESDTVFNRYNRIVMNTSKAFVSYKWSNGSNIRSNDFWAYDLGAPGKYNIWCEVTDINGCSASDTITIHTDGFTNINDPYLTNVQIYPNPADSRVEITTTLEGDLKLNNAEGKLLLKQNVPAGKSELDCSQLSTGVYTIEINGTVHKLVVRH
ncbi:MAG TPA: T9SS type A sorting domain-containing protein [Bacteroidia bacterium]